MAVKPPPVVDASVLGAAFFNEADSTAARRFLQTNLALVAPDLVFIEIASLAAKKVWRGEASEEAGNRAIAAIKDFVQETASMATLASRAFDLAARHRFSAYDAAYIALAELRGTYVVTLDGKLAARAQAEGLGAYVDLLPP